MALFVTLLLAVGVGLLMLLNSNRARCRMKGHDWGRPYTDDKRRLERCERCFCVRDHVHVAPKAEYADQESIDGSAPVVFTVSPRVVEPSPEPEPVVDEVAERRAELAAKMRAKWGSVSAESKVQS